MTNRLQTGFIELDNEIEGLKNKQLIWIERKRCNRENAITLLLNILSNAIFKQNKSAAFFCSAITTQEIIKNLLHINAGVSEKELFVTDFDPEEFSAKWKKFTDSAELINHADLHLYSANKLNSEKILETALEIRKKGKLDLLIIENSDFLPIKTEICSELKEVAESLDIPIIATSRYIQTADATDADIAITFEDLAAFSKKANYVDLNINITKNINSKLGKIILSAWKCEVNLK